MPAVPHVEMHFTASEAVRDAEGRFDQDQPISSPRADNSTSLPNRELIEWVSALSESPYHIDLDSIRRAFPPGTEPPPLLLDFATWLTGRPWGSVGCFALAGQFPDDASILDGSLLRDDFALSCGCRKGPSSAPGMGPVPTRPMRPS